MATPQKKDKSLQKTGTTQVVEYTDKMQFERDAGLGLENADRDSYAIPFLQILQTNSPQCDDDDGAHVKGAKPGMIFNTATGEIFDGKEGVSLVPCHFERRMVEWVPRESGGGFRGSHSPDEVDLTKLDRDDSGKFVMPNGNNLVDTRYHFCVLVRPDGTPTPVVLSLASTQIKKSRQWMTKMSSIKLADAKGQKYTPPTFSHLYKLTTVSEQNEKGSWKGIQVEVDRMLTPKDQDVYVLAKEFKRQVQSGQARVEEPPQDEATENF